MINQIRFLFLLLLFLFKFFLILFLSFSFLWAFTWGFFWHFINRTKVFFNISAKTSINFHFQLLNTFHLIVVLVFYQKDMDFLEQITEDDVLAIVFIDFFGFYVTSRSLADFRRYLTFSWLILLLKYKVRGILEHYWV